MPIQDSRVGTLKAVGGDRIVVNGSFATNTTNDPTVLGGDYTSSVARDAAGIWTVTLSDYGASIEAAHVSVMEDGTADFLVKFGDLTTDGAIEIRGYDGATPSDMASATVYFTIVYKNTTRSEG